MKICKICGEEKDRKFFPNISGAKCRKCQSKLRVIKNRKREIKYRDISNAFIIEQKSKSCEDCGKSFHYSAMDFDHIDPKIKNKPISRMKNSSKENILKEIALCRLICGNCHRNRTQNQVENNEFKKPTNFGFKDKPITGTVKLAIEGSPSKICRGCKRDLHISSFVKWSKGKDGLKTRCRECRNTEAFNRRKQNPEKFRLKKKERSSKSNILINNLKDNQPCVDCGEIFRYWCLDYDHKEGVEKFKPIAKLKGSAYSMEIIFKELELCELRCVNCHRVKTFNRKQHDTNPRIYIP